MVCWSMHGIQICLASCGLALIACGVLAGQELETLGCVSRIPQSLGRAIRGQDACLVVSTAGSLICELSGPVAS